MSTSCEKVSRHILPLYRSFTARELTEKYSFTQVNAAKSLGTTQAAISQYVTSKRGSKGIQNYEEIAPSVQKAAAQAARQISEEKMTAEEFSVSFCELCNELRREKKIT